MRFAFGVCNPHYWYATVSRSDAHSFCRDLEGPAREWRESSHMRAVISEIRDPYPVGRYQKALSAGILALLRHGPRLCNGWDMCGGCSRYVQLHQNRLLVLSELSLRGAAFHAACVLDANLGWLDGVCHRLVLHMVQHTFG